MALGVHAQKNSVLSTGTWLKFSVGLTNVYKIDYQLLRRNGINPDNIDPRLLRVYAFPTGMLPQKLDQQLVTDLQEVAIVVEGEADGRFDRSDYILFYGEGPDRYFYREDKEIFGYENNLYADRNYYYVTVGTIAGKRVATNPSLGESFAPVTQYEDFGFYETESHNELKSGREWWGELFDTRLEIGIRFDMPGIVAGSSVRLVSSVMAKSVSPSQFSVAWNGTPVLTQEMGTIPNTQYGVKGRVRTDTISFAAAGSNASQNITIRFAKGTTNPSIGYLNHVLFTATRNLEMRGDVMPFVLRGNTGNQTAQLANANSAITLWQVQNPFDVKQQGARLTGTRLEFGFRQPSAVAFLAFQAAKAPAPTFETLVRNQNLHRLPDANLVIITHPDLKAAANRLAAFRQQQGISAAVVTTDEIYNEFSGGRQDVSAIRNFLHVLYQRTPRALQHALLFGRGSYDYKKRVFNNTNLVPTYESRNSLSPLETYSSDDFFGFLELGEGEWRESPAQDHTLDIGVGRLPGRTLAEANQIVDKLIRYEDTRDDIDWRRRIAFVADDGDFNIHQSQADQLAGEVEFRQSALLPRKVYLDYFPQEERASGQFSPLTTRAIKDAVKAGSYIVNFVGHGSEQIWMQERVLDQITITEMRNAPRWPLFVTATCEFGRTDDPLLISTGELLLLRKDGGAIGLVTTARPVNSSTNFTLNRAFYNAFFQTANQSLGAIFRITKNRSLSGVANRNFSLLGDPSLPFGLPTTSVRITEVKTQTGSDTLKALSTATIRGEIVTDGNLETGFIGWADVALYDKAVSPTTRGDENPPFSFSEWTHPLFQGKVRVVNGRFEARMVLPANLNTTLGLGKISVIAQNDAATWRALGARQNILIGGTEKNIAQQPGGPVIELFLGDTTFVSGGLVSPTTRLIGKLSDPHGINQAGYRPQILSAVLDDSEEFDLTAFYSAAAGDATRGRFELPLENLAPGRHVFLVKAYDTFGNRGTQSIEFIVSKDGEITVDGLQNFPNPFTDKTMFAFSHSRSGEDLAVTVTIFNSQGQPVHSQDFEVPQSNYQVVLGEWDGYSTSGTKMPAGIYFYRASVRSLSDGAKNERFSKLILLN
jgi:hypothetical protein